MHILATDAAKKSETIIIPLISLDTLFNIGYYHSQTSSLINMVKCRREYNEAEQRIEHLAN
jgi:hypothetical protein